MVPRLKNTFKNQKVVVTGHTGFKGSWLSFWLHKMGAEVVGVSKDVPTTPSHFETANLADMMSEYRMDIRDGKAVREAMQNVRPDFVFHLAAQALVRRSYIDPVETWQTNVMGTLNVLEALRQLDHPCVAVIITSDKCYDNVEWVWGYRETDAMGGPDPYSASKGAAELAIRSHIKSFFSKKDGLHRIASARAGNVIGGGDWADDRLVPDCVRAWSQDETVELRNPHATRPWQHVLEPLSGYLTLAMVLSQGPEFHGEAFNFGPPSRQNHSVLSLVEEMAEHWPQVRWETPKNTDKTFHESGLLKLNCDKALHHLQWHAVMNFEETVKMTAEWYREFYNNPAGIAELSGNQIDTYCALALKRGLYWAE